MVRVFFALAYAFTAWLASAVFVFVGYRLPNRAAQIVLHSGGVLICFVPVFRAYFARPDCLPAPAVAGLTVGFIILLDIFVVSPAFLKGSLEFFRSFWDWQLPALFVIASILLAGRR